jgi:hypothetical protein
MSCMAGDDIDFRENTFRLTTVDRLGSMFDIHTVVVLYLEKPSYRRQHAL